MFEKFSTTETPFLNTLSMSARSAECSTLHKGYSCCTIQVANVPKICPNYIHSHLIRIQDSSAK